MSLTFDSFPRIQPLPIIKQNTYTHPIRSDSAVPLVATELSVGALLLVVAIFWTTLDMTGGPINGGDIVDDMVAATSSSSSSSSLELNNFNDWLGVLQERYLGAKDASTSSV